VVDLALVGAIARAVEREGGDMADVVDLVQAWERLEADARGRLARLRAEAASPRCRCATAAARLSDGRCSRCFGWVRAAR
jgi:hypothetical protein